MSAVEYCFFFTAGQNVFVFPKFPLSPLSLSEPVIRVIPFPFCPPSHLCKSDIMQHTFQNLPLTQFPIPARGQQRTKKNGFAVKLPGRGGGGGRNRIMGMRWEKRYRQKN